MKTSKSNKITFAPSQEIKKVLALAPSRKVSERINELIDKGLSKEKEEQMQRNYEGYGKEIAKTPPRKRSEKGVSSTMLMSQKLFADDEDSNDEDLI